MNPKTIRSANLTQFVWTFRFFMNKDTDLKFYTHQGIDEQFKIISFQEKFLKSKGSESDYDFAKVSSKTIYNWLRYIKENETDSSGGDKYKEFRPVNWYEIDEKDLPWEFSGIWVNFRHVYERCKPSMNFLRWWWRLKQLDWSDSDKHLECALMFENKDIQDTFGCNSVSMESLENSMWEIHDSQSPLKSIT